MNRTTPALIGVGVIAALGFLILGTSYGSKTITPEGDTSGSGNGTPPLDKGQTGNVSGNAGDSGATGEGTGNTT